MLLFLTRKIFAVSPKPLPVCKAFAFTRRLWYNLRQYHIILSADTASEVRQMPSQKRR